MDFAIKFLWRVALNLRTHFFFIVITAAIIDIILISIILFCFPDPSMPPTNAIKPPTKLVTISKTFKNRRYSKQPERPKNFEHSVEPKQPWCPKIPRRQGNVKPEAVVLSEEMAAIAPYAAALPLEIFIKILLFLLPRQGCLREKFCQSWELCQHTQPCPEGTHGLQLHFPKPALALHINQYTRNICLRQFYATEPMVFVWSLTSPGDALAITRIEGKRADNNNYLIRQLLYNGKLDHKRLDDQFSPPVAMPILYRHWLRNIVLTNPGDQYIDHTNWSICLWPFEFNFTECPGLATLFLDFRILSDPARRRSRVPMSVVKETLLAALNNFNAANLTRLTVAGVLSYHFAGDKQWFRRLQHGFGKAVAQDGKLVFIDMKFVEETETLAESSSLGQPLVNAQLQYTGPVTASAGAAQT